MTFSTSKQQCFVWAYATTWNNMKINQNSEWVWPWRGEFLMSMFIRKTANLGVLDLKFRGKEQLSKPRIWEFRKFGIPNLRGLSVIHWPISVDQITFVLHMKKWCTVNYSAVIICNLTINQLSEYHYKISFHLACPIIFFLAIMLVHDILQFDYDVMLVWMKIFQSVNTSSIFGLYFLFVITLSPLTKCE